MIDLVSISKIVFSDKRIENIFINIILKKQTELHKWVNILFGVSNMESRTTRTPEISAAGVTSLTQRHSKSLAGHDKKDKFALTKIQ